MECPSTATSPLAHVSYEQRPRQRQWRWWPAKRRDLAPKFWSKIASSMGRLGVHGRLHHEHLIKVLKKGWLNLPNQELTERQMMKTKQQDLVTCLVVYPEKTQKLGFNLLNQNARFFVMAWHTNPEHCTRICLFSSIPWWSLVSTIRTHGGLAKKRMVLEKNFTTWNPSLSATNIGKNHGCLNNFGKKNWLKT